MVVISNTVFAVVSTGIAIVTIGAFVWATVASFRLGEASKKYEKTSNEVKDLNDKVDVLIDRVAEFTKSKSD